MIITIRIVDLPNLFLHPPAPARMRVRGSYGGHAGYLCILHAVNPFDHLPPPDGGGLIWVAAAVYFSLPPLSRPFAFCKRVRA